MLYLDILVFKTLLKFDTCLGFVNLQSPTIELKAIHTLHCLLYKVKCEPNRPELSSSESSQERAAM